MKPTLHALDKDQHALLMDILSRWDDGVTTEAAKALAGHLCQPLTIGEALNQVGDDATNPFVAAAGEHRLLSEGTLELDTPTVVSEGDDGAYVMVWLFIDNEAAGVTPEEGEDE